MLHHQSIHFVALRALAPHAFSWRSGGGGHLVLVAVVTYTVNHLTDLCGLIPCFVFFLLRKQICPDSVFLFLCGNGGCGEIWRKVRLVVFGLNFLSVVIVDLVLLDMSCVIVVVGILYLIWIVDDFRGLDLLAQVVCGRSNHLTLEVEGAVDILLFKAKLRLIIIHYLSGLASHASLIRMTLYGSTLSFNPNARHF